MFQISTRAGRTEDLALTLFKADGVTAATVASNDTVRIKVYRGTGTPVLDLSNDANTANGSSVAIVSPPSNNVSLRLAQGDTSGILPGCYRMEISIVDNNDNAGPAHPIKPCDWGLLDILPGAGGAVGA